MCSSKQASNLDDINFANEIECVERTFLKYCCLKPALGQINSSMERYLVRPGAKPTPMQADILERRKRVDEKIIQINWLPGWQLDRSIIQSLPIREAEHAVECVYFLEE